MAPTCPKCAGSMADGYLLDIGDQSQKHATDWVEGSPERSFWFGLKTKGKQKHPVRSYRCDRCGFLELYARSE